MPYLLSHYASALSVCLQFRPRLCDGEHESGHGGWTLLWLNGDDDDQPNDVWAPLGLGETDVNVRGLFLSV